MYKDEYINELEAYKIEYTKLGILKTYRSRIIKLTLKLLIQTINKLERRKTMNTIFSIIKSIVSEIIEFFMDLIIYTYNKIKDINYNEILGLIKHKIKLAIQLFKTSTVFRAHSIFSIIISVIGLVYSDLLWFLFGVFLLLSPIITFTLENVLLIIFLFSLLTKFYQISFVLFVYYIMIKVLSKNQSFNDDHSELEH